MTTTLSLREQVTAQLRLRHKAPAIDIALAIGQPVTVVLAELRLMEHDKAAICQMASGSSAVHWMLTSAGR